MVNGRWNTKFKENDKVVVDNNKFGTILHCYDNDVAPKTYEVEVHFFDDSVVKTVTEDELLLVTTR